MSDPGVMTRQQKDQDRTAMCVCGLHGKVDHHRVSRPGEEPEQWIRVKFSCPASGTREGPHEPA